ncbi:hypothetical protein JW823_01580 [bacterium]|nr:hypothetical protein [candidate division CSSED10-310 bacterium]
MADYLLHPFVLGFGAGVLVAVLVWISGVMHSRRLKGDMRTLKEQLQLKMELDAEATAGRKQENEQLKQKVANMQASLQALREKPGRRELELLHIYDRALQKMFQNAPGFASAWQSTLDLAEAEFINYRKGVIPFIRRVIRPSSTGLLKPGNDAQ